MTVMALDKSILRLITTRHYIRITAMQTAHAQPPPMHFPISHQSFKHQHTVIKTGRPLPAVATASFFALHKRSEAVGRSPLGSCSSLPSSATARLPGSDTSSGGAPAVTGVLSSHRSFPVVLTSGPQLGPLTSGLQSRLRQAMGSGEANSQVFNRSVDGPMGCYHGVHINGALFWLSWCMQIELSCSVNKPCV